MKKLLSLVVTGCLCLSMVPAFPVAAADEIETEAVQLSSNSDSTGNPLRMWYTTPGNVSGSGSWWQEEVLALGNGHIGGMVFGGVANERVHFNDKTLWAGGPVGPDGTYNGGNRATPVSASTLETIRKQLDDKSQYVWGYSNGTSNASFTSVNGAIGSNFGTQGYQDFGDIYLNFAKSGLTNSNYSNYVRDLDMTTAVSTVNYTYDDVDYVREYFVSHPDDVMVMNLTASESGKITFDASIAPFIGTDKHATENRTIVATGDTITYKGNITNNKMQYEAQLKVINAGGSLTPNEDGTISVAGADSVTLIMSSGTDYKNVHPSYRSGVHPGAKVTETINDAAAQSYEELKARHIADHSEMFGRVSVNLNGGYVPDVPTDELVLRYQRSMIPAQPYVNVIREGSTATIATSGQISTTYSNARAIDNNNNTIWISNNISNPYAIISLGSQKTFDMLQLVSITPEYIVEYNTAESGADVWEAIEIESEEIALPNEFQDVLLTFEPITTNKIRVSWDSTRKGLGNKAFMNRSLGEIRAYDSTRPAAIDAIATDEEQRALEVMCYQMGRYMTIAGSREGDPLPTNLCGIWLIGTASGLWNSDFHFNINVQMNYWPTLAANLAESATVFNDYVGSDSVRTAGRVTAEYSHGVKSEPGEENGFMVHVQNSPFGHTAPGSAQEWGWNPGGSIWALQNVYDYYLFTGDENYLREKIYPMMREQADFWLNYLWYSEYQGRWVSAPSHSAEQGPMVNGSTYDQSLVWQHFENTIQAAEILGVDADKIDVWREKQAGLDPIQIGDDGQIKEWYEETTIGRAKAGNLAEVDIPNWRAGISPTNSIVPHRHPSHLVGLFPGTLINKDSDPEILNAAMVSLDERGFGATSWGKSHKINAWARTGGSKEAYYMIRSMVGGGNGGFMKNLFSSHGNNSSGTINYTASRIFQIDGNYGYAAGFNEVLLQSQLGYVQFLPAVYDAWDTGDVKGIVARGNFVIDMEWSDGIADKFTVTARRGGEFIGEYAGIAGALIKDSSGEYVDMTRISADKVSFDTVEGGVYTIEFVPADKSALSEAIDNAEKKIEDDYATETWNNLQEALETAKTVNLDEEATQYEIDRATKALNDAIEALVSSIKVTGIKITSSGLSQIRKGKTLGLKVAFTPDTANFGTEVTWSSSNPAVVKVDEATGVITGVKAGGSARITATSSNGKIHMITVTVTT